MNLFKKRRRIESAVRGAEVCAQFAKRAGYFVILTLVASFLFLGCPNPKNEGNLIGTWNDGYTEVVISSATIKFGNNYEGDIKNSPDFKAANGVLIIQFTGYWDADYTNYPDVEYTANTDNVNQFGALYWANLTETSVNMSDAGTGGFDNYEHTMFGTLTEAQNEFTLDKAGTYASLSGTAYTK